MKADQRLYRTADDEVVAEGDPRAAFLLVNVGKDVPEEYEAKAAKLLKKAAPAEDKAVRSAPNKAVAAAKKK